MKFASRLVLAAAAVATLANTQFSRGSLDEGGGGTGGGSSGWTIVSPLNGGLYASHPGYLGAGVAPGTGALCVYQRTDLKPGAIYPSELTLLYSENLNLLGSSTWSCQSHGESGKLFACVFPTTFNRKGATEDILIRALGEEVDVEALASNAGGASTAFKIGTEP